MPGGIIDLTFDDHPDMKKNVVWWETIGSFYCLFPDP